jgi:prephenate dehydrogenase
MGAEFARSGDMTRVAVAGLGLIGGSIALAYGARGWDRERAARDAARRVGIDARDSLAEALEGAEVVFAAVPTAETPRALIEISAAAPGALLTDTASLKRPIVAAARELRAGTHFVAGHPMAGSHRRGVEFASAELFRGRPWALCRTARTDDEALSRISALVRTLHARPVPIEAEAHDRLMTWVSHLPLAVASALTGAAFAGAGEALPSLAGPGLLDTTRVASHPTSLALELALANPAALADAIDAVGGRLQTLASALRRGDEAAVRAFFEEASARRSALIQA